MRLITGLNALKRAPTRAVVAVGMFDGVHVAHQRLIRTTICLAKRLRGTSVVITFDPDPQQVLDPVHAPVPFMPLQARVRVIQSLGVNVVWIIPFTPRFSRTSPEMFVQAILLQRLHASCVVVGETFAFGRARRGNLNLLQRLGQRHGMRVVSLSPVLRGGRPVSSSRIRQLIADGELAAAQRLLGRPIELFGTVVRGEGRARTLGFPTANIQLASQLLPPRGVYRVWLEHAHRRLQGVMNLGFRPTFGPGPLVCEVHLVGFNGSLYGQPVTIALLARLRDEQRFESPEALARQIQRDLAQINFASQNL